MLSTRIDREMTIMDEYCINIILSNRNCYKCRKWESQFQENFSLNRFAIYLHPGRQVKSTSFTNSYRLNPGKTA